MQATSPVLRGVLNKNGVQNRCLRVDIEHSTALAREIIGDDAALKNQLAFGCIDCTTDSEILTLFGTASLFKDLGRLDEALATMEYVVSRDPACTPCVGFLESLIRRFGRPREAAERLETMLEWGPPLGASQYEWLGYAWLFAAEPEKALQYFSQTDLSVSANAGRLIALHDLGRIDTYEKDFTAFDEDRQEWMIGIEAYRTGSSFLNQNSLTEVGSSVMRALVEKTGETANLAVAEEAEVVFIGQIESANPIRAFFPPGSRSPMHASGTGKAILSAMTENDVRKLLLSSGLKLFTECTHVMPDDLFKDLALTRERGWSLDREERYLGMSCIGGVIFDKNEQPSAAVSISGPNTRFDVTSIAKIGPIVAHAASEITRQTGGRAPIAWPNTTA